MARSRRRTLRHLTVTLGALALLAPQTAGASPGGDCFIRRAEVTTCPAFHVFEDGDYPRGLSGDGTTVVGGTRGEEIPFVPVRWVDGARIPLHGLPPGLFEGGADVASFDGTIVGGTFFFDAPDYGTATYRWQDGVFEIIDAPAFGRPFAPVDMSADGRVIALFGESFSGRWTDGVGIEPWAIPGFYDPVPSEVSADGQVFAGTTLDTVFFAFEWAGDTSTELPVADSGRCYGGIYGSGISPDGHVIVGQAPRDTGDACSVEGALWRDHVFERREFPLRAASWDGLLLAGVGSDGINSYGPALYWDASGRMWELEALLTALGVEVPFTPRFVEDMSYDGHVLLGHTGGPDAVYFLATVSPEIGMDVQPRRRFNHVDLSRDLPLVVRLFGSEQADVATIDPQQLWLGPARAHPIEAQPARDRNGDGYADRDFAFDVAEAGLAAGDQEVCLAGIASDLPFRLCSPARVTLDGCGRGAELALLLPLVVILRRRTRRPPAASPAAR